MYLILAKTLRRMMDKVFLISLRQKNGMSPSTSRNLDPVQSWFYFGLLGVIFDELFNGNNFIDTTAEGG